jgi:hypothetical protein
VKLTHYSIMQKAILPALFLLITFSGFSQQLLYGSGGTVYNYNNVKMDPDEVRQLLANDSKALELYNSGRSKKTWGNVLFYGGLALVTTNLVVAMNTDNTTASYPGNGSVPSLQSDRSNMTAAIIGGVMVLASVPIKIGYPKKIKSALGLYNKNVSDTYNPQPKTTLLASGNQIGFKIEF